jgi:DNA repair protein RadC
MNPDNIRTLIGVKNDKKNIDEYIFNMTENELQYKGLSKTQINKVFALKHLIRDVKKDSDLIKDRTLKQSITDPEIIANQIRGFFIENDLDFMKEHFLVCLLDVRNRMIDIKIVSQGTLTASLVHPRETFEHAIKIKAASIIVTHNHPSGDVSPSEEDIRISRRLKDAGKILGIELLDHVIITPNKFCSLKDKGLI